MVGSDFWQARKINCIGFSEVDGTAFVGAAMKLERMVAYESVCAKETS